MYSYTWFHLEHQSDVWQQVRFGWHMIQLTLNLIPDMVKLGSSGCKAFHPSTLRKIACISNPTSSSPSIIIIANNLAEFHSLLYSFIENSFVQRCFAPDLRQDMLDLWRLKVNYGSIYSESRSQSIRNYVDWREEFTTTNY